jgi:hypothetical protein
MGKIDHQNRPDIIGMHCKHNSSVPRIFFGEGGVQQIQLETVGGQREGRSGGGSPLIKVPLNLQMSETRILISLLQMYFPRNRKFGSALSKLLSFGVEPPNPTPVRHWCATHKCSSMAPQLLTGQGLLTVEDSRSHSDTPHPVWLVWSSDQPDAKTSTWQHTTLIREKHPCPGGIRTHNPSMREATDPPTS